MADYVLVSFPLDALGTLVKSGAQAGAALSTTIQEGMYTDIIKPFPRLVDLFGAATDHPDPQPLPLSIGSEDIGTILGRYYDGTAVGADTKPALVPPESAVCLVSGNHFNELYRVSGTHIAANIEQLIDQPQRHFFGAVAPVFINDTGRVYPLHIVKASPFLESDKARIYRLDDGTAWNMKQGYTSIRLASLVP